MLNLNTLNDAQREAVMHGEGPLLVLAGPGSGKTFTITQRILYLIEEMQVDPSEILVITFTKEAALSMQHRFQEQSKRNYPVIFGTFHSVFYQILKNVNPSQTRQIWGESQKKNLIISILKKIYNTHNNIHHNYAEAARAYLRAISYYKNTDNTERATEKLSTELRTHFSAVFRTYEAERKAQGAIDFDDMVYECAKLLETDAAARAYWSGRFSHILMDEFQDINPMQYRVIGMLTKEPYNLFAVGDDDQAIYGFRGSKPACMKQFETDYGAKRLLLNINYRSRKEIVEASLRVIETNKERFSKKLIPFKENAEQNVVGKKRGVGKKNAAEKKNVELHRFVQRDEEYEYLMQEFERAVESSEESFAVLFRTNMFMQGFAARLSRRGISYEMKEKNGNIYEHIVVKDIMAYLRIAQGEANKALYLQILNKPVRFISREALYSGKSDNIIKNMQEYYQNQAVLSCAAFVKSEKALQAIGLLEKQLHYIKNVPLYLAVQYISKVIGYECYLQEAVQKQGASVKSTEEWQEILEFVKAESREYASIQEWVQAQKEFTAKLERTESTKRDNPARKKLNLHLMTVHASKGLEFDRVFIPDCNEKVFPHGSMPDKEQCEEECRIFYVAMTRAKKNLELLYLTGTKERPRMPSRFLNPLL